MAILIDGYNLLHATGILGRGVGPGGLERARRALLNCLARALPPEDLAGTTIVFDAKEAPPGLPAVTSQRGLTVRYATRHEDADALIVELIRCESSPRRLTVVSSDRMIRSAARRRRAQAVKSDEWYDQLLRRPTAAADEPTAEGAKPSLPLLPEEIDRWLAEFGNETSASPAGSPSGQPGPSSPPEADPPPSLKSGEVGWEQIDNPFPHGYADDLFADDR